MLAQRANQAAASTNPAAVLARLVAADWLDDHSDWEVEGRLQEVPVRVAGEEGGGVWPSGRVADACTSSLNVARQHDGATCPSV